MFLEEEMKTQDFGLGTSARACGTKTVSRTAYTSRPVRPMRFKETEYRQAGNRRTAERPYGSACRSLMSTPAGAREPEEALGSLFQTLFPIIESIPQPNRSLPHTAEDQLSRLANYPSETLDSSAIHDPALFPGTNPSRSHSYQR